MRKWIFYSILIIPGLCFGVTLTYSISDLEVLEREKNTTEFLRHALDIKPIKRDKHYKEMVEHMAIVHIDKLINKKEFKNEEFQFIEEISRWPLLEKDPFFQSKRGNYAHKYLESCFQGKTGLSSAECSSKLYSFWHNSPKDPDLGVNLISMIGPLQGNQLEQFNLIEKALNSKQSEYHCQKPAVVQFLEFYATVLDQRNKELGDLKKQILKTLNSDCLKALIPQFKKNYKSKRVTDKASLFNFLRATNSLKPHEINEYYLDIFLEAPGPSKELNLAWNSLKRLGESHQLRMEILRSLKERSLLPGKLFQIEDKVTNKTMVNYLYQNFPEYIDLYTKTCISYMQGSKRFPLGNPTPSCKLLFEKHPHILNQSQVSIYRDIVLK